MGDTRENSYFLACYYIVHFQLRYVFDKAALNHAHLFAFTNLTNPDCSSSLVVLTVLPHVFVIISIQKSLFHLSLVCKHFGNLKQMLVTCI